jgi:NhaP-type Na+/H+ or K+/H+ antiporter
MVSATFDPHVSFLVWMALVGSLLLSMSLFASSVQRVPVSSSGIYLLVGILLGPHGLGWVHLDFSHGSLWLERLTEAAVVVSLFVGGMKLRLPTRHAAWRAVWRLAVPLMVLCILGVASFAHLVLGLPLSSALLLGAVLAPTDPVLASAVTVNDAADRDRLRYGLSGEAGLNDGMAFPFVVLALSWHQQGGAGAWLGSWALLRLLWAVPAALAIGYGIGRFISYAAMRRRSQQQHTGSVSDFLALSLILLSYATSEALHAWGFLAVFAAGVGLRSAELSIVAASPHPAAPSAPRQSFDSLSHPPAEHLVAATENVENMQQPAVAAGATVSESLSFGHTTERLLELLLVCIVGVSLTTHWDVRALPVALVLFVLLRPLCARLLLIGTPTSSAQRWLMGWFGIRGIGSLYYLTYSLNQADESVGRPIVDITISVVALSILVHGMSARPLLARYERSLASGDPRAVPRT